VLLKVVSRFFISLRGVIIDGLLFLILQSGLLIVSREDEGIELASEDKWLRS